MMAQRHNGLAKPNDGMIRINVNGDGSVHLTVSSREAENRQVASVMFNNSSPAVQKALTDLVAAIESDNAADGKF